MSKESPYLYQEEKTFSNSPEVGGIIGARKHLDSLKATNKPFLEKHPEYTEDYNFFVGEFGTTLKYYIYKKTYGSEEDRGNI